MEFRNEYAFLSNMYSCPIHYDGEIFPCVETAFQYAKTGDASLFTNSRGYFVGGLEARKIGRSVKLPKTWNDDRIVVMYELLEDKFYHNKELREALKQTGDIFIQEDNTWGDTFWGVCNGEGYNMLGKMIMEIRENIIKEDKKGMKIIVAGSRSFNDYYLLCDKLNYYLKDLENPIIVCGEARGADALGKMYAYKHNLSVSSFPADWSIGRNAGYIRNETMAKYADALIAFWDGKSKGTEHMIKTMRNLGKRVRVVKFGDK